MKDQLLDADESVRSLRRLLIIGTLFYPHAGVNAVRATQWSRHLPEFGWKPLVLCRNYGEVATAEDIRENIHPEVEVEYLMPEATSKQSQKATAGRTLAWKIALAKSVIGKMVVPDTSLKFWRGARGKAMQAIEQHKPDVILTTSPAHSVHDLGLWLTQTTGLPWIADFQDPYLIDVRYRPHGFGLARGRAHRNFDESVYRSASKIVHAIPIHARWARLKYPFARDKVVTIPNGCPTDLAEGHVTPDVTPDNRRSLRVVGFTRNHEALTLARATKKLVSAGNDVELRLVGPLKYDTAPLVRELGDRVACLGLIPHDQALSQIAGADVLICILSEERSRVMRLSSKLFEYLATGKPIIVVNPTVPDRQLLHGASGVRILSNPNVEQMTEALAWSLSTAARPSPTQAENFRSRYNRRAQADRVAELLNELINRYPPR